MSWSDPIVQIIALVAAALIVTMWAAILAPAIKATRVRQLLAGVAAPPLLVAWIRRGITAGFALIIVWVSGILGFDEGTDRVVAGTVAAGIAESAWGILDQFLKPDQNDANPGPVAGGAPASLLDPAKP